MLRKSMTALCGLAMSCCLLQPTNGDVFQYVDWLTASPTGGVASGVITLPDTSTVDVEFEVLNADGSPGTFSFAQTAGGTNYWNPDAPYLSTEVENAPPSPDILALVGGDDQTYKLSLSEPIKDPVMAIVSLGRPGIVVEYDFDRPFTIVSQGTGYWGGTDTSLASLPGDILSGEEGHGTIRFNGTFDAFSWTADQGEFWHGFNFAIRTTEALEPTIPEPTTVGLLLVACVACRCIRSRQSAS